MDLSSIYKQAESRDDIEVVLYGEALTMRVGFDFFWLKEVEPILLSHIAVFIEVVV